MWRNPESRSLEERSGSGKKSGCGKDYADNWKDYWQERRLSPFDKTSIFKRCSPKSNTQLAEIGDDVLLMNISSNLQLLFFNGFFSNFLT